MADVFVFADCELDIGGHVLRRAGEDVHIEPQVFDLLALLADANGALVSYDAINEAVWKGRIVSDATVSARIGSARAAVGDTGKKQAVIQTVARVGLKIVVPVSRKDTTETHRSPTAQAPDTSRHVVRYVTSSDGVRVAYGMSGSGPPIVRVGHWLTHVDLDWASPVWRPLLDRLGRHHTVYRFDQRGTGLSDREFPGKGIDEFVDDLAAIADATGADRVPIFTASQGVAVALKFAARYLDRVGPMVLYGGYAQGRFVRGTEASHDEARAHLAMVRSGWGQRGSAFMEMFSTLFIPEATPEQSEDFIKLQLASATAVGAVKLREVIDTFDVTDILSEVRAPVLLIHGRGDRVQPVEQSQLMARCIPNAQLITTDSINHVPLPHDPAWELLMRETERFLLENAPVV